MHKGMGREGINRGPAAAAAALGRPAGGRPPAPCPCCLTLAPAVLARIRRSLVRSDLEALFEVQNRLAKATARVTRIKVGTPPPHTPLEVGGGWVGWGWGWGWGWGVCACCHG
jgi:hypothetical protein